MTAGDYRSQAELWFPKQAKMVPCVDFGNPFDTYVRGRGELSASGLSTLAGGIGYLKAETITICSSEVNLIHRKT